MYFLSLEGIKLKLGVWLGIANAYIVILSNSRMWIYMDVSLIPNGWYKNIYIIVAFSE